MCVQMDGARLGWYANEMDPIEGEISDEKFRNKSFKTKQNKWWDPNLRLALGWDWRSIVTKAKNMAQMQMQIKGSKKNCSFFLIEMSDNISCKGSGCKRGLERSKF